MGKNKKETKIQDLCDADSDSDEKAKNDTEAKEDDKGSVEGMAEVERVLVEDKSGKAEEIVKFKAEKSSQEVTNLKNTLKSSLEQAELINCQVGGMEAQPLAWLLLLLDGLRANTT